MLPLTKTEKLRARVMKLLRDYGFGVNATSTAFTKFPRDTLGIRVFERASSTKSDKFGVTIATVFIVPDEGLYVEGPSSRSDTKFVKRLLGVA